MAWKITFTYKDESTLKVSGKHKALPVELAIKYQSMYSDPHNDGGKVQISPYKHYVPVPLDAYISQFLEEAE